MSTVLAGRLTRWQDPRGSAASRGREAGMADPSDAQLLALGGQGAGPAFATLVRRYGGPLYAIAFRRLGSAADAEEAVQDAFLLLWRKRHGVRLVGDSALPWLIVAVKHVAANRARSARRRTSYESAVRPPDPLPLEERSAVADLLRRAFDALPPVDAEIARLCLAEDLGYAEAAARLGLTEGAVRNRLSRARRRLRQDLEQDRWER